jgi:hypothetical protein
MFVVLPEFLALCVRDVVERQPLHILVVVGSHYA